jgi:hypothetical protein
MARMLLSVGSGPGAEVLRRLCALGTAASATSLFDKIMRHPDIDMLTKFLFLFVVIKMCHSY